MMNRGLDPFLPFCWVEDVDQLQTANFRESPTLNYNIWTCCVFCLDITDSSEGEGGGGVHNRISDHVYLQAEAPHAARA